MLLQNVIAKKGNSQDVKKEALIIAGETLTMITEDAKMKEDFLTITDTMDVVLACRVSPKQKGDIV